MLVLLFQQINFIGDYQYFFIGNSVLEIQML